MLNSQRINPNQEDYYENYYFIIKSGEREITVRRPNKKAAQRAFQYYLNKGEKLEWLGKWAGSTFQDTETPQG